MPNKMQLIRLLQVANIVETNVEAATKNVETKKVKVIEEGIR